MKETLEIGDSVIVLEDLFQSLSTKTYQIEYINESVPRYYYLSEHSRGKTKEDIYYIDTNNLPLLKYPVSQGEADIIKIYLQKHIEEFKRSGIKVELNSHDDGTRLLLYFNFKSINDFFAFTMALGKHLGEHKEQIEIRNESFYSYSRKIDEEISTANKRWEDYQNAYDANDVNYDENGMKKNDEYNPNNWEGHH